MWINVKKTIKHLLSILAGLLALYLFAALILSILSTSPEVTPCSPQHTIFITSNGVHLDIIISNELLPDDWKEQIPLARGAAYLSMGWGDKEFYLNTPAWNDLQAGTAFRALFTNSESAMHLTSHSHIYPHWRKLDLCSHQLERLMNYLDKSFKKNAANKLMRIPHSGYSQFDTFYYANGSFSIIQTCNQWVNKALQEAQVKTSIWSPFDRGVLYHLPD